MNSQVWYQHKNNFLWSSWATPAHQLKVQRYKPRGTVVDAEYHLHVYERNVQVTTLLTLVLM